VALLPIASPAIPPLNGRQVDHSNAHEHQQGRGGEGQDPRGIEECFNHAAQKLMLPSPLRPQTTMAMENVNIAAREAQPTVTNMPRTKRDDLEFT
jgi:hypothetical protein